MKSNTLIAFEWLWSLRGKGLFLRPSVLTADNRDPSAPKLTIPEAMSVFKCLEEEGLIFRTIQPGGVVFLLHEAKAKEWNAFIESHSQSSDQRSPKDYTSQEVHDNGDGQRAGMYELIGGVILFALGSGFTEIEYHRCALLCYYFSVQFGVAAALHYLKRSYRHAKICFWILTGLILAVFVFLYFRASQPTRAQIQQTPAPVQPSPQNEQFIEGTDYTEKHLNEIFPFGYAIFFVGQNKPPEIQLFTNNLMNWTFDVKSVSIIPNSFTGKVEWRIPNIAAVSDPSVASNGFGGVAHIHVGVEVVVTPFRRGFIGRANGFVNGNNQPNMYVGVLSDNQRLPVFTIGFRITTPEETSTRGQK